MNQVGLNSNRILNFKATQEVQLQENSKQQIEKPPVPVQLPQIYNVQAENPSTGLKETVKKYDMMGLVYPWLEHPLMMLGTCTGLALGVDKFAKSCGGEYETSLVGRAAKMGDNLQTSKFVKSKPFQTVLGWGKSIKEKFCSVTKNSDVINAIRKTPSRPEWSFVRD